MNEVLPWERQAQTRGGKRPRARPTGHGTANRWRSSRPPFAAAAAEVEGEAAGIMISHRGRMLKEGRGEGGCTGGGKEAQGKEGGRMTVLTQPGPGPQAYVADPWCVSWHQDESTHRGGCTDWAAEGDRTTGRGPLLGCGAGVGSGPGGTGRSPRHQGHHPGLRSCPGTGTRACTAWWLHKRGLPIPLI